jgi:glycosyltransferase involved in cell wall biosynthesis
VSSSRSATQVRTDSSPLDEAIAAAGPPARAGFAQRARVLLRTLDSAIPGDDERLPDALEDALRDADADEVWLMLAVMTGVLPTVAAVAEARRLLRLDGPEAAILGALTERGMLAEETWPPVEVIAGEVVLDLHHTSSMEFSTGIQRVVRQTAARWLRDHELVAAGWTRRYRGLRRLDEDEIRWVVDGPRPLGVTERLTRQIIEAEDVLEVPVAPEATVVPWRCRHVLTELAIEPARNAAYKALAIHSAASVGLVGHDCIPLVAAETTSDMMPGGFCSNLAAAAFFDHVAATSGASAAEYLGWKEMLAGSGRTGPIVTTVALPVEAAEPSAEAIEAARRLLAVGSLPIVLVVGSHEPRKNHMTVLHCAETLWREGFEFTLTFIGGHAWKSEAFEAQVQALQTWHRPVQTARGLPDDVLWAAYRLAYCTVFVSVHEGFGLPLAESLASGTPAIASNIGSMKEIGAAGGALFVDPVDDEDVTGALRRMLSHRPLRDRLAAELAGREWRTWDEYASELWDCLVEGRATHAAEG